MGRPRKYDWDDKHDVCHKLWEEDKLSAPQIVKWFAAHFNIPEADLPNPNQFHQKFREWGFTNRRPKRPEEEEARLVARCRELFNQNMPANEIQKKLNEEGWGMDNYKFRTFRKKYGMLMRNLNGYKPLPDPKDKKKRGRDDENENEADDHPDEDDQENGNAEPPPLAPEEAAKRARRLIDLQQQSDELLHTRKRRRRIRGYGHIGPDDPSIAPRYGSETSLDECKAYLNLPNEMYVQVRTEYADICRDMGITKMTLCAEGQWQASKDRLVMGNMYLSSMLQPLHPDLDRRLNALNCICSDVTKRMRNEGKAMSIADASNILGLDPIRSKETRRRYYEMLEADHFTTALACGKEHLTALRDSWCTQFDTLQQAMTSGDPRRVRAVEVLSRDARKRFCDDRMRKNPDQRQWQKQKHYGPGPGPAHSVAHPPRTKGKNKNDENASAASLPAEPQQSSQPDQASHHPGPIGQHATWFGRENELPAYRDLQPAIDFELDPLLSATPFGPLWPPQTSTQPPLNQTAAGAAVQVPPPPASSAAASSSPVPAYFRLASGSQVVGHHPHMWLGKLASGTSFASLRHAATSKSGAATLVKVHGIVKDADGREDSYLIESDEELAVYLSEAGEKPTFAVLLEGGYA